MTRIRKNLLEGESTLLTPSQKREKSNSESVTEEPKSIKLKKQDTRKRVLYFDELEDKELITKTKKRIDDLKVQIQNKTLISLQKWCDDKGVDLNAMIRLLFEYDYPVIRIGTTFQGVYQEHIDHVLLKETERQLELQLKNRVCAKVLAERQHESKRVKQIK